MESLSDPLSVSQRLDRLERAYRRLKCAVTTGLLGLAALGAMGQVLSPSKIVEAEEFVVRDPAGRTRATLSAGAGEAGPRLRLLDSAGKTRVRLGLLPDGSPALYLVASGGHRDAESLVAPDGFYLYDSAGKLRAVLGSPSEGPAFLSLFDPGGNTRAHLSPEALKLADDSGKPRAVLGEVKLEAQATDSVVQRPVSSLVLFNRDGGVLWKAP